MNEDEMLDRIAELQEFVDGAEDRKEEMNDEEIKEAALALTTALLGEDYAQSMEFTTDKMNDVMNNVLECISHLLGFAEKSFEDGDMSRVKFCLAGLMTLRYTLEETLGERIAIAERALSLIFQHEKSKETKKEESPSSHWAFNT